MWYYFVDFNCEFSLSEPSVKTFFVFLINIKMKKYETGRNLFTTSFIDGYILTNLLLGI